MSDGLDNGPVCVGYPLGVSSLFMGWLCDVGVRYLNCILCEFYEFSSYNKENVICTTSRANKWSDNKKNTELDILKNFGVQTTLDPIHSNTKTFVYIFWNISYKFWTTWRQNFWESYSTSCWQISKSTLNVSFVDKAIPEWIVTNFYGVLIFISWSI